METKQYFNVIDKADWGAGAWQSEPDKMQWADADTGLPCLIVRGPAGALCGYVGVSPNHPLHGKEYGACVFPDLHDADDVGEYGWHSNCSPEGILKCHGGLTFSRGCSPSTDERKGICHIPAPGEPDHVWWFGFDCAHCDDLSPKYDRDSILGDGIYRNLAYVQNECRNLARQIKALATRTVQHSASQAGSMP